MSSAIERRAALEDVYVGARGCTRCPSLVASRTQVVFGAGNPGADLLLVGEAPGRDEDLQGVPFVGRSGKLLDELLDGIGLRREDVFVTNVLRCRPPDNRNPTPAEIESCSPWLWRTLELVQPRVVCPLGNFATKLLRGDPTGIAALHGRAEDRRLGPRRVRLLPLFHPAAALYTSSHVEVLRADFAQLPELLALPPLEQAEPEPAEAGSGPAPPAELEPDDLRLF